MAEALGAVAAVVQLLDKAIDIFKALKHAGRLKERLAHIVDEHRYELVSIKELVETVKNEPALRTTKITATLLRLKGPKNQLVDWVKRVDPGNKSLVRRFANQLVNSSEDRKELEDIMAELNRVKLDLSTMIQIQHVALSHKIDKGLVANSREIREVTKKLVKSYGEATGVGNTQLRQSRSQVKGLAQLNDSGISSMESEDDQSTNGSEPVANLSLRPLRGFPKRTVTGNRSEEAALMLNAPVGPDKWTNDTVEIKNNVARGTSFMLNYPNSKEDIGWLMDLHEKRQEKAWQRQNRLPANPGLVS